MLWCFRTLFIKSFYVFSLWANHYLHNKIAIYICQAYHEVTLLYCLLAVGSIILYAPQYSICSYRNAFIVFPYGQFIIATRTLLHKSACNTCSLHLFSTSLTSSFTSMHVMTGWPMSSDGILRCSGSLWSMVWNIHTILVFCTWL